MKPYLLIAVLTGCAARALVPGQSTLTEVESQWGKPAEVRPGPAGETVYYYPQLPWGYATYAARIGADGRLVAMEQRLTPENIARLKPGVSRADDVRDLLGPPFEPMKAPLREREIWTYPMRFPGAPIPRWFLAQFSPDGVLRETWTIDDPNHVPPDGGRRRR